MAWWLNWDGVVAQWDGVVALGWRGGSIGMAWWLNGMAWWLNLGWRGGSMVAHQTVVLQSRVQIRHLPSPQQTANLLEGCHLGWHFAEG
jgi:hypothetical protein